VNRTAALVPAAGRGERLGPGEPKALREIAGVPILIYAVSALASARSIDLVVVAAPQSDVESVTALLSQQSFSDKVSVVAGGDTRQESVARALIALPPDVDVVLVHDAARPLVPIELISAVVGSVRAGNPAVVPGLSVTDTIKEVNEQGDVLATIDRNPLRAIQTPQGFDRELLQRAHAELDESQGIFTDDAGLIEAMGVRVKVIEGHVEAMKITLPFDLAIAETIIAKRRASGVIT
jgi:2-C-methyl-D-erythritol 4-phosphate cytidylyltransferase